ncbi:hypothetical protein H6G64_36035 [Calothrix sp. FACHB-156]|nr:hypothetical protein [Calothrix sp. FACHB-156]
MAQNFVTMRRGVKSIVSIFITDSKSGEHVGIDENSQKPEQIKQSIIDGDIDIAHDVNIDTVNQTHNQANVINNNYYSTSNTPRIRLFQAPPTPEYYVDRPEVSQDLKQRLLADGGTLVISAIHGLGSVGKSTLAAALAHDADIQKHFDGGVLWATLGQEPDVLSLLGGWVQGLGDYNYRATSIEATSAHLNTLLFDKAVLLVVDDAWIDEKKGWEPVKAFRVGGDRCRMLVTTRDASIANFLGAITYSLDVMTETQALALLIKKAEKQGKRLQEGEIESAQALAKAVGYLPLGLELAAAQVASGTSWQVLIADIQQEIARLKSFQDPGIRNISDDEKFKKLSLQASLNLSVKGLSESDRSGFAWLGVLPEDASITPKMTATLWEMDERDAGETLQYLRSQALLLPGVFLVDGTATYRLHDLFHDLARNLLTAPQKPKRQGDLVGLGMKWEAVHSQLLDKYQQQTENNLWHTLADDGYIHQHLVWHLEKAGRVDEIHQLLREDAVSGSNGWYEVREKLGQTAGFLTDVTRVWELAEVDWERKNLSQVVGLQCRYALIIASLNSLAANIPAKVISHLVKSNFWYPEQGLAYALQKHDLEDKIYTLIELINYLPTNLKNEALRKVIEFVCLIKSEYSCTQILIKLSEKIYDNFYYQTLEIIIKISNELHRIRILNILVQRCPEELYIKLLEAASQFQDESYKADFLNILAKKLSTNLLQQALCLVNQIKDKSYRNQASSAFVESSVINTWNEALNIIDTIQDKYARAKALANIANKVGQKFYKEILYESSKIVSQEYYDRVLTALAYNLQDNKLYEQSFEVILKINFEYYRLPCFIKLVEKSPKKICENLLQVIDNFKNILCRGTIIIALAKKLKEEHIYHRAFKLISAVNNEKYFVDLLSILPDELPIGLSKELLEIAIVFKY